MSELLGFYVPKKLIVGGDPAQWDTEERFIPITAVESICYKKNIKGGCYRIEVLSGHEYYTPKEPVIEEWKFGKARKYGKVLC